MRSKEFVCNLSIHISISSFVEPCMFKVVGCKETIVHS